MKANLLATLGCGYLLLAQVSSAASVPITSGLVAQFDASNPLGTGPLANGTSLTTWNNLAPGLPDGAPTAAVRGGDTAPKIGTGGAFAPPSGLPVVQFNGSTDAMATSAFTSPVTQGDQVFLVWYVNPSLTHASLAFDGLTDPNRQSTDQEPLSPSTPRLNQYAGNANYIPYSFTGAIEEGLTFNGASSKFTIDGAVAASGNPGTNPLDGLTLGSRLIDGATPGLGAGFGYLDGYLAEILVYNTILSSSDATLVENYLINKWLVATPEPASVVLGAIGMLGCVAVGLRMRRLTAPQRSALVKNVATLAVVVVVLVAGTLHASPLLVVSSGTNQILKYDGTTGASLGAFVSNTLQGSGPAGQTPSAIAEGPDGNVYVGYWGGASNLSFQQNNGGILEYNQAGTLLNTLNVGASVTGIAFAPTGNLYIAKNGSGGASSVDHITASGGNPIAVDTPIKTGLGGTLRGIGVIPTGPSSYVIGYAIQSTSLNTINPNGTTGTTYAPGLLNNFVQTGVGVRSDGTIFVSQQANNSVYTVTTSSATLFANAASDTTNALNIPGRFAFDAAGDVYFGNVNANAVAKYSPTGTFLGEFVSANSNGLNTPQDETFLTPVPEPSSVALAALGTMGLLVAAARHRRQN